MMNQFSCYLLFRPQVERLHADKHKLEDKLNSLEKARIYERTLSESESTWLDELDGAGSAGSGKKGDSVERKETESDIGVGQVPDPFQCGIATRTL